MGKALSVLGGVISFASLVVGIWLQFKIGDLPGSIKTAERLTLVLESLTPLAVGLLLIAAGRVLTFLEARAPSTD
jgi:hypothetical protein